MCSYFKVNTVKTSQPLVKTKFVGLMGTWKGPLLGLVNQRMTIASSPTLEHTLAMMSDLYS